MTGMEIVTFSLVTIFGLLLMFVIIFSMAYGGESSKPETKEEEKRRLESEQVNQDRYGPGFVD